MVEESRGGRPLLVGGEKLRGQGRRPNRFPGEDEKYHPYTIEQAQARLRPQAASVASGLRGMSETMRGDDVVFEATLEPNYIANSYFPQETLARNELYVVGARQTSGTYKTKTRSKEGAPTKTLLLAGRPDLVGRFVARVADENDVTINWEEVREFSDLSLPNPSRVLRGVPADLGEGELITWEAVLHPSGRQFLDWDDVSERTFQKFLQMVRAVGGDVDTAFRRVVDGLTFVPVLLHKEGARLAAQFNPLRTLSPMPKLRGFPAAALRGAAVKKVPVPLPTHAKPSTDERIAIFDGGIPDNLAHFAPFVRQHHLTSEPPDAEGVSHGTAVTSAFLFGHVLPSQALPQPVGYVDHYRVYPPPSNPIFDDNLYWVLDRIEEVAKRGEHRFVNLSFAPDIVINDQHEPHRWTSSLDRLARDYGTIFVCAAGNNGKEDKLLGQNRVQVPSDMVNGITVGACKSTTKLLRAPYSAVGPGRPGQRVQPLGVHFGGSLGGEPFCTVDVTGDVSEREGTSFAAPLGTRSAVDIRYALPENDHSHLHARTFFAHYASRSARHRLKELGYGRLRERFDQLPPCLPHECSVLYEEKLGRDETVAMNLAVPTALSDATPLSISWTISYFSETDSRDAFEYTLDGLEVTFRPHARRVSVKDLNRKKDKFVGVFDYERDAAAISKLQEQTLVEVGDVPVPGPAWRAWRGESRQREDGKWETLICGEVEMPAKDVFRPRIDVHYLRRLQGQLLKEKDGVPPLVVSMLATARTLDGTPIYDLVRTEYPALVPVSVVVGSK